eukprot:3712039-Pyramimonas_sp.AAC.1
MTFVSTVECIRPREGQKTLRAAGVDKRPKHSLKRSLALLNIYGWVRQATSLTTWTSIRWKSARRARGFNSTLCSRGPSA